MSFPLEAQVWPIWILLGGFLFMLIWEAMFKEKGRKWLVEISSLFLLMALISNGILIFKTHGMGTAFFKGTLIEDTLALKTNFIVLIGAFWISVFGFSKLLKKKSVTGEFFALIFSASAGMIILIAAQEWITLIVGLELASLSSYALIGYLRTEEHSVEAALKYFLMSVFASTFLLFGISFLYGLSGRLEFNKIQHALNLTSNPSLLGMATILLIIGLGFKVGVAPFHFWAPEVYDGTSSTVAGFLATAFKAAVAVAFLRVFLQIAQLQIIAKNWFVILAGLTMVVGNIGALVQTRVKKMLAYSSVAHVGYLLIAFTILGQASSNQIAQVVYFYLFAYALMTLGAFGWVGFFSKHEDIEIHEYNGMGNQYPWLAGMMVVFLFSLAGIPPTIGFFAKYYIFKLAVAHHQIGLVIFGVINSLISMVYYLKLVIALFMKRAPMDNNFSFIDQHEKIIPFILFIFSIGICVLGFVPGIF
jgi:NADH-quinone oxidoreductase subunit N